MMSKTIVICNKKGGVGKTATAVNLSAALTRVGKKVLVIDLDSQHNATQILTPKGITLTKTISDLMENSIDADVPECICKSDEGIDFIGSSNRLTNTEIAVAGMSFRETILNRLLVDIQNNYDYIIIDCPPSVGLMTLNALSAADGVIIPIKSNDFSSLDGFAELIKYIIIIMVTSSDEEQFQQRCRQAETTIASVKCKARGLANLQKNAYKAISPYHVPDDKIENVCKKLMPISTYAGGFPFASSSYSDGRGYYFAKDVSGGMVAIDPWLRHGDRTNSNWVIMGVAGQGKSATTKHIITEEYAKGTKIILIDPEREYKKLTKDMGVIGLMLAAVPEVW